MAFDKIKTLRWSYRVLRSVLFSVILAVIGIALLVYILLSIPPIHNKIRDLAQKELTNFLGEPVEINELEIIPLNQVILKGVTIKDPYGKKCLEIDKLAAGISLSRLLFRHKIEITYIELIDFRADIYKKTENEPYNIDFIIKALQPKDKNKPPTKFDLQIRNIVVRRGDISYSLLWKEREKNADKIDFNYLNVTDFSADVALPRLSNELQEIDLRRLAFNEKSGLSVKEIGGYFTLTPERIDVKDFILRLPETVIHLNPFSLPFAMLKDKSSNQTVRLQLLDSKVTPSDLSSLLPVLNKANYTFPIYGDFEGNLKKIKIDGLTIKMPEETGKISIAGQVNNLSKKGEQEISIEDLKIDIQSAGMQYARDFIDNTTVSEILNRMQFLDAEASGNYNLGTGHMALEMKLKTEPGSLEMTAHGINKDNRFKGGLELEVSEFQIESLFGKSPVKYVSGLRLNADGDLNIKNVLQSNAKVGFELGKIDMLNREIANISGNLGKTDNKYNIELVIDDNNLKGELNGFALWSKTNSVLDLDASLEDFDTYSSLLTDNHSDGLEMRGRIGLHAEGTNIDNLTAQLEVSDFYLRKADGRAIDLDRLNVWVDQKDSSQKSIILTSEIMDLAMKGNFRLSNIPKTAKEMMHDVAPAIFPRYAYEGDCGKGVFDIDIKEASQLIDFFALPIFPLTQLTISGSFDGERRFASIDTEIPYIQQGKNNLIRDTYLNAEINGLERLVNLDFGTIYPTKKGDLKLDLNLNGLKGLYNVLMSFNEGLDTSFKGETKLTAKIDRDEENHLECDLSFLPSTLYLNGSAWKVGEATVSYTRDKLSVDHFDLHHENQFVMINGFNDKAGDGIISLQLADIDLDYIFDTLNIPHVNFGGTATGRVRAEGLLSGGLNVQTEKLDIINLSYNGAVMGNGDIRSRLNLKDKMVEIGAKISEDGKWVADVDGGVWFGRDSLSFDFDTDKVNIAFLQPFMQAFSSKVSGRASGKAKLFGTFSDIDMTGVIKAEEADILIDYINVHYIGSDSVFLNPGRIDIPDFTIRDKDGNTAKVKGEITHRYFHDPAFKFSIFDMDNLLVYDTNRTINPLWYGVIHAKGVGDITGEPGWVRIAADVETEKNSSFTFVLSDQQEAVKTKFLTFSDKRKEKELELAEKAREEEMPEFLKRFYKKNNNEDSGSEDIFTIDIRATVSPAVQINLIMDPIAGDKITAEGEGAMNLTYSSRSDELRLYGKYTLEKGTYNFSLQDIILKDFTIKPGSSIAFTGDPYTGILDITAAYRVNTSLTELDQSFATDKELNRTSVPVEALLKVTGPLMSPSIGFDIDLPTVTEETAQKVKSIISTDDMMSRQVLYLVALNKFYPPEYMTTSNSGGEWASVASSTISSQLQNIIGQLTDKFTLAPSIRSDKGDFSDLEVDIALSSNLFNNRLLLNGNIGYRDPSNSSTMFVGDFDLEYLLNKAGTWRLKAYNHFNDQNYYLKSALTTQGIGIVWRKDFGFLNSLTPKKRSEGKKEEVLEEEIMETESGLIE